MGGMMNMIDATREQDADHRFAAAAVESFIGAVLTAVGLPAADAAKVAQLMTEADLTGADAHGVFRLPQYVRRDRTGRWRQRHGAPGGEPRRRDRDRTRPRCRCRLGGGAPLESCRYGGGLFPPAGCAPPDRPFRSGRGCPSYCGGGGGGGVALDPPPPGRGGPPRRGRGGRHGAPPRLLYA